MVHILHCSIIIESQIGSDKNSTNYILLFIIITNITSKIIYKMYKGIIHNYFIIMHYTDRSVQS